MNSELGVKDMLVLLAKKKKKKPLGKMCLHLFNLTNVFTQHYGVE